MEKDVEKVEISICPHCGMETTLNDPNFCIECGECLKNYCTNNSCPLNDEDQYGELFNLPLDAKFCYECGSKSTFYDILVTNEN